MRFLIEWKDNGEQAVHNFGVLPEGQEGEGNICPTCKEKEGK